jgi:hypothetical protein
MSGRAIRNQQKRRAPPSRPAAVRRGEPAIKKAKDDAKVGSGKAKAAKIFKAEDSDNEDLGNNPFSPDISPPSSPSKARVALGDLTNVAVVEELQSQVKWLKEQMMTSLQHGVQKPKMGSGKLSALASDCACLSYLLRLQVSCGLS